MSSTPWREQLRTRLKDPTQAVFFAILALMILWFGSGILSRSLTTTPEAPETPPPSVAASWSTAQSITRELVLYGDIEPSQIATLRARVDGIVEEVVTVGTRVSPGDELARLSSDDREARHARARAQLRSAELDYEAQKKLAERGMTTPSELENHLAQLEAARAELRSIEVEVANTRVRAPIEGDVNRVIADIGSYVSTGGEVLEVVDNDPLLAVVYLHQSSIGRVRPGMSAQVHFFGDQHREGIVSFVAPVADARTRTFRVEITIDNPELDLPSGLSAEVVIPVETVKAHRISAALGRLDAQGQVGINVVDEDNRIAFAPIEVVRAQADGLWVTGLPERARVVTISQGALTPGQVVDVRDTPEEFLESTGLRNEPEATEPHEEAH